MGLKLVCVVFLFALIGCMGKTAVIKGKEVHYSDCCNPGLSADEKQMCKFAAEDDDRTRWDVAGNKYVYVWSGCEVGKEPWRKWD